MAIHPKTRTLRELYEADMITEVSSLSMSLDKEAWNRYVAFVETRLDKRQGFSIPNYDLSVGIWWEDENDDRLFVLNGLPN